MYSQGGSNEQTTEKLPRHCQHDTIFIYLSIDYWTLDAFEG